MLRFFSFKKKKTTNKMSCKKGEIMRKGYTRKSYTKRDGTKIEKKYIKPVCIKDKGLKGKGEQLFKLRRGTLSKYGYSLSLKAESRRKALAKAIKGEGALPVYRKLNALYILQKNTNPINSRKFYYDRNWVTKYTVNK